MSMSDILFYIIGGITLASSAAVILAGSPLVSSLFLAISMIMMAFMYYLLEAYFISGVQLIVYAGAVMILFVMVLMLFDLKKETDAFAGGVVGRTLKVLCAFLILGAISGAILNSAGSTGPLNLSEPQVALQTIEIKALARDLFTKYLFAFEALGLLLLLIAIGVVAVSRIKGGTHA